MSSAAKIRANRRNGAKSRGPKSAEGKARSARNRLVYAIDARAFVAAGENVGRFRELAKMVLEALQPRTRFERLLVHRLCAQLWQRDRLLRIERAALGDVNAAASLPEGLRENLKPGATLEQLARLVELQVTLDHVIQQSIALLLDVERARGATAAVSDGVGHAAADEGPSTSAVESVRPHPDAQLEKPPAGAGVEEIPAYPRHRSSMAAPQFHFGKKRPSPPGR